MWRVVNVTLQDYNQNVTSYTAAQLAAIGFPTNLRVYAETPRVTLVGRVYQANGRNGVAGATVSFTDETGATRTTKTNPFGYYRFYNVTVGASHVFYAIAKRRQFNHQTTRKQNQNQIRAMFI